MIGVSGKGLAQKAREVIAVLMTPSRAISSSPTTIAPLFARRSLVVHLPSPPPSWPNYTRLSSAIATMTSRVDSSNAAHLDDIFKQKRALRSRVRRDLKAMDPSLRSQEDNAIQRIILDAHWFKSCKILCAYISCGALREVDTSQVLSHCLQNQATDDHSQITKKIYVPRVEDRNSHMRMLNISSVDDLIANSMNILEPAPVDSDGFEREDVVLADEPVDLFLLPGLAFDKSGRRLGRGGGYYDTFLARYQELARERKWKQPLLIALSYSLQIVGEGVIPLTPNDVLVDALVSPSGLIPISTAAMESCQ